MRKAALVLIMLVPLAIAGCGYSLLTKKAIQVSDIKIGKITNGTNEPELDDELVSALSGELMKQGIHLDSHSQNQIYGTINSFVLTGVTDINDVFTAYQVSIEGKFYFKGADGREIPLRGQNPFIVTFQSTGQMNVVYALRQVAVQGALKDLSSEIVSSFIYR